MERADNSAAARLVDDILNKFNRTKLRNGLYSVAKIWIETMSLYK
jgi:hypothetical protein